MLTDLQFAAALEATAAMIRTESAEGLAALLADPLAWVTFDDFDIEEKEI